LNASHIFLLRYTLFMRIVLQRISEAAVSIEGEVVGKAGKGYLLLVGCMQGDTESNAQALAEKIVKLRLFDGEDGKINDRSILDCGGDILVVSQFTLAGRTEKGNRPDYTQALAPAEARVLYERFIEMLQALGVKSVESGEFGAHMMVSLVNDGPVTLILDK